MIYKNATELWRILRKYIFVERCKYLCKSLIFNHWFLKEISEKLYEPFWEMNLVYWPLKLIISYIVGVLLTFCSNIITYLGHNFFLSNFIHYFQNFDVKFFGRCNKDLLSLWAK